jgi:hypothetical protein
VIDNIDPDADRPRHGAGARRARRTALELGHALRAGGRHPGRAASSCRPSARRSGWNSSRAIRTIRSGPAASGAWWPMCPVRHGAARHPARAEHRAADHRPEHAHGERQRPTPVTGGIVLKGTAGAMIVVNDTGIYISNGPGASITLIGPTVAINMTALTVLGPMKENARRDMPGPILHMGAVVTLRAWRQACRPRRALGDGLRHADRDHRRALQRRRLRLRSARGQRPLRDRQWSWAHCR